MKFSLAPTQPVFGFDRGRFLSIYRLPLIRLGATKVTGARFSTCKVAALLFTALLPQAGTVFAELPVPCGGGSCGGASWLGAGAATQSVHGLGDIGQELRIQQLSERALFNWDSFNIGRDDKVSFDQPGSSSLALNRIFQQSPSRLLGSIQANGQVYLINRAGIIFGKDAQINVGTLLASSLEVPDINASGTVDESDYSEFLDRGLASFFTNGAVGQVAHALENREGEYLAGEQLPETFTGVTGPDGQAFKRGGIWLEQGAQVNSAELGKVMLYGSEVTNAGIINTPQGQTIIAASKDKLWIEPSSELRGFVIELNHGGDVSNLGEIIADEGNVSLLGRVVRQDGLVRATTSVDFNGSILLRAEEVDSITKPSGVSSIQRVYDTYGDVVIGEGSVSEVVLDDSGATAVDAQPFAPSRIEVLGEDIDLQSGARIAAQNGVINIEARASQGAGLDAADITLASGVAIDVSGADAELPMSRNVIEVQLFSNELKDAPLQRDGTLRGETLAIDVRKGSPLVDIAPALATIPKTVEEKAALGGSINIQSSGSIAFADDVQINLSGGEIHYNAGLINTSRLVTSSGTILDVSEARPDLLYQGLYGDFTRDNFKWGVTQRWTSDSGNFSVFESGYSEFQAGGTLAVSGAFIAGLDKLDILTEARLGQYQRRQVPRRGTLLIGRESTNNFQTSFGAPGVSLLKTATQAQREDFQDRGEVLITEDFIARSGISLIDVMSNGGLVIGSTGQALELPDFASLKGRAKHISVDGGVVSHSGTIELLVDAPGTAFDLISDIAPGLNLAEQSLFDVSGRWQNDFRSAFIDAGESAYGALAVDGGSVVLGSEIATQINSQGQLVFDLSGGGVFNEDARLELGKGGSLAINFAAEGLTLNAEGTSPWEVKGFGGRQGASFDLTAPQIQIDPNASAGLAIVDKQFVVGSGLFSQAGFSDLALTTTNDDLLLPSGDYQLARRAFIAESQALADAPGGGRLSDLLTPRLPGLAERSPLTLTLGVGGENPADLVIATGARITTDAGGSINLSNQAEGKILVDGLISAPAGSVNILATSSSLKNYNPLRNLIWLGPNSRIDVAGAVVAATDPATLPMAEVLDGGSVAIAATGYVVTESGSSIDVSGTAGLVSVRGELPDGEGIAPGISQATVGSDAGAVSIFATEGLLLGGGLSGSGGLETSRGGLFTAGVKGDRALNFTSTLNFANERQLLLDDSDSVVVDAGFSEFDSNSAVGRNFSGIADQDNGKARLSLSEISRGDFTRVELAAQDRIVFSTAGDTDTLKARFDERLFLEAPTLTSHSDLQLEAGHIRVSGLRANAGFTGSESYSAQFTTDLLDVLGSVSVDNVGTLLFESTGDIRMGGVDGVFSGAGKLQSQGLIELKARQVYPLTLANFDVIASSTADREGEIRVTASGAAPTTTLTAGGALNLKADSIFIDGMLKAPFGSLKLEASKLELAPRAVLSVAADAPLVPFGDRFFDSLPETTGVELLADDVVMQAGSLIDLSGGGDLVDWNFIAGPGGSQDILDGQLQTGRFAIVPGVDTVPLVSNKHFTGDGIGVGSTLTLRGAGDLADGEYTLLPARYALLDGAWLISQETDYADIAPASTATLFDGTPLVAGRLSVANSPVLSSRYSALALRPGSDARLFSEFDDQFASLFQGERSTGEARFWQPADAAQLQVSVVDGLRLGGTIKGAAADGGHAGLMSISAENLAVVKLEDSGLADIELLAEDLNRLDVGTLLIGGTATRSPGGLDIKAEAYGVEIADGLELSLPELVLTAKNRITIGDASLVSTGQATSDLELGISGGDAAVALLASPNVIVSRTAESTPQSAEISIADGAALYSEGTALVSSQSDVALSGASVLAPNLFFEARRIVLGEGSPTDGRLRLLPANLPRVSDSLTLKSAESIGVYNTINLDNPDLSLTIAGPGLSNVSGSDLSISARELILDNPDQGLASGLTESNGVLTIAAERVLTGDNTMTLEGWRGVVIEAGSLQAAGTGELALQGTDSGQFMLSLLMAKPGGELTVSSSGLLHFLPGERPALISSAGLGGRFTARAEEILFDTKLWMPSGTVDLQATNDLNVAEGGVIDVAGLATEFLNIRRDTWGGSVSLGSASGDVQIAAGATIDVSSGGPEQRSGWLELTARQGTVDLAGELIADRGETSGDKGGRIKLDALAFARGDSIDAFAALNQHLNTGGFSAERKFRQREGDLLIGADTMIDARDVVVRVDGGSLTVAGTVNASGGDEDGGRVELYSRDDMNLAATTKLSASSEQGEGGVVAVGTESGWLNIFDGASIRVDGSTRGGQIDLRAPRTAAQDDVQIALRDSGGAATVFDDELEGADQIRILAFRRYTDGDGSISASDVAGYYSDTADFIITQRSAIRQRLGLDKLDNAMLSPGLVVERVGDLSLDTEIDFLDWVFAEDANAGIGDLLPGHFILQATGDLTLNASLTSGANEQCGRRGCSNFVSTAASWSFDVLAGADDGLSIEPTMGDLQIADNTLLMTSTGDISVSANGDLNLQGQVLTLGRAEGAEVPGGGRSPAVPFNENGGDIRMHIGGSIRGDGDQALVPFVTDGMTFYESTTETGVTGLITKGPSSQGGGSTFDVGSLGGGDITISAGADIAAFSAATTTGLLLDNGVVTERINDGNVDITTAGDFNSSLLVVGDGDGYLQVGGAIGVDFNYGQGALPAYSRFALQGGQIEVNTVRNIDVGGALNPTLPYFLSYGENSSFDVQSLAGDIEVHARELSRDVNFDFPSNVDDQYRALPRQYPGSVSLTAHQGGIAVDGQMRLSPSAKGWLGLLAEGNISLDGGGVQMSELDPATIPLRGMGGTPPDLTTNIDKFAVLPELLLQRNAERPVAIISRRGDIGHSDGVFNLQVPMAVNVFAGGGIVRPQLRLKHAGQSDVSSVLAGGGIRNVDIEIEGPGRIDIAADNDIDFDNSPGVTSFGGVRDSRLVGIGGAGINMYVGALPDTLNWSGFIQPYRDNVNLREKLLSDIKVFLKAFSKPTETDRETLMTFMAMNKFDLESFSSETYTTPSELKALLTGLALDLELTSVLANSNVSDKLRETFLNDPLLSENLVDSLRLFRNRSVEDLDSAVALQLFNVLSREEQGLIVERTLLSLPEIQQREITLSVFNETPELLQRDLVLRAFFGQLRDAGRLANEAGSQAFDLGYEAIESLFPKTEYSGGLDLKSKYKGDLTLAKNRIYTLDGGDINLLIPGGSADAGLTSESSSDASKIGVVVQKKGDVRAMVHKDFVVNQSRVFTLGGGNILMWASQGNLDAGRGAKTAISSPPPKVTFGVNGELIIDFGAAIAGSGIRQIETAQSSKNFDIDPRKLKPVNGVDLVAPNGEVNAGDAGIGAAGNLNIAAARVVGAEQIEVGGVSVGIPDDNSGAAASLVGVSNVAGDATGSVADSAGNQLQSEASNRLAFLEVNVLDFGARTEAPSPAVRRD